MSQTCNALEYQFPVNKLMQNETRTCALKRARDIPTHNGMRALAPTWETRNAMKMRAPNSMVSDLWK